MNNFLLFTPLLCGVAVVASATRSILISGVNSLCVSASVSDAWSPQLLLFFLKICFYFISYNWFILCISVHLLHAVSALEARRGHPILWSWSNMNLWATRCILGIEIWPSLSEQEVLLATASSLQFLLTIVLYWLHSPNTMLHLFFLRP